MAGFFGLNNDPKDMEARAQTKERLEKAQQNIDVANEFMTALVPGGNFVKFGYDLYNGNANAVWAAVPFLALDAATAGNGKALTTVGRWMSKAEYEILLKTGKMIEGAGGQTFVSTGGSEIFASAAKGSVYAEFQVATNNLLQGGKENWFKIIVPNSNASMQNALQKQGGEMLPQIYNLSPILKTK